MLAVVVIPFHRPLSVASSPWRPHSAFHAVPNKTLPQSRSGFRVSCSSQGSDSIKPENDRITKSEYKPRLLDDCFLSLFRNKMAKEVGWDSKKPGYDGLIEVANRLMLTGRTNSDTRDAAVRILRSLFPPLLLDLYKMLVSPLGGGKVAAMMVARVTAITCQWLMGKSTVNSVELPGGTSWESGVFVERCKYLEESKCVGVCVNTCKFPTQTFFKDYMGVPLLMEPNFTDYSCQFKFGVLPPLPDDDSTLKEPCLEICPIAGRRREVATKVDVEHCPKVSDIWILEKAKRGRALDWHTANLLRFSNVWAFTLQLRSDSDRLPVANAESCINPIQANRVW